jgi:hypothetical protein
MRWIFVAGVLLFLCPGSHAADGICPNEELLRSRKSNISTEITFINDTGGSVRLYWINFEGGAPALRTDSARTARASANICHATVDRDDADCATCSVPHRPVTSQGF